MRASPNCVLAAMPRDPVASGVPPQPAQHGGRAARTQRRFRRSKVRRMACVPSWQRRRGGVCP